MWWAERTIPVSYTHLHLPQITPQTLGIRFILLAAIGVHKGGGGPVVPPGNVMADIQLPVNQSPGDPGGGAVQMEFLRPLKIES